MYRKQRRILEALALGIAVAALAAPTALAEPRGPGNPLDGKAEAASSVGPDDRAFARVQAKDQPVRWVSPDDRPLVRSVETPVTASSRILSLRSDAFQWWEAGVGATSMLGFILLAGATTLVVRHQRRRLATP